MLTRLTIQGYKSLRKRTPIELKPLTVLTGVNSSGKSSVIQTMLMTAQSMQCPFQQTSVVLNGPLAQLGTFDDVLSTGSNEMSVAYEWRQHADNALVEPDFDDQDPDRSQHIDSWAWFEPRFYRPAGGRLAALDAISLEFRLTPDSRSSADPGPGLPPVISSADLGISDRMWSPHSSGAHTRQHFGARRLRASLLAGTKKDPGVHLEGVDPKEAAEARAYEIVHGIHIARQDSAVNGDLFPHPAGVTGVLVRGLMPEKILVRYDATERNVQALVANLIGVRYDQGWGRRSGLAQCSPDSRAAYDAVRERMNRMLQTVVRDGVANGPDAVRISSFLESRGYSHDEEGELVDEYYEMLDECLGDLSLSARRAIGDLVLHERDDLLEAARTGSEVRRTEEWQRPDSYARRAMDLVKTFFKSRVKFLGPLREGPHSAYEDLTWWDPQDVGVRGERTAAVLASFGSLHVDLLRPPDITDAKGANVVTMSLLDATRLWLQFLGVADDMAVRSLGAMGYSLTACAPGLLQQRELVHLGTGVSQVLPVLVMSLLAPKGSLLLFEQPELHLHPRVQARLADFFYSMTLLGKQCIVESHSEYLVDRIRYLCVAESDNRVADNVRLYFSDMTDGGTVFRAVEVNEHGVIADWPHGFFDESKDISYAIVQANLAKLRREQQRGR